MVGAEVEVGEPLALSRHHKVVLVDDDPAVLGSLRRLLRREPYDVLSTAWPALALQWVQKGDISLVVLDQRMPSMCGTELAERVRQSSPETIRVLLTAYPGNAAVQHGLSREVQWLISKPWNDDALRLTLRQLLHQAEAGPPSPRPEGGGRASPPDPGGIGPLVLGPLGRMTRLLVGVAARVLGGMLGFLGTHDASGGGSR